MALSTARGGVVERLVAAAADIVGDGDLSAGRLGGHEELASVDDLLPHAVAVNASAADATPAVAILVTRRKGGSLQTWPKRHLPALLFAGS